MNDRVSVIIPGCNEGFMQHTIDSLLAGAQGDVEIIAVLDGGPWPDPPLKADGRVIVVRHAEMRGMRQSFNEAAGIASGRYLMKCDAHTIFAPSWDVALKSDCDDEWVVVPTRHSIDGIKWKGADNWRDSLARERDDQSCIVRRDYNYHYLTWPYSPSMYGYGLHGKTFSGSRLEDTPDVPSVNTQVNRSRAKYPIDNLMSFQGSCWFTTKEHWTKRLGPLDWQSYGFYSESIEIGMRTWCSGGKVVVNKRTWYAHLHKGNNNLHTIDGRDGRGFFLDVRFKRRSEAYATDYWMNDKLPGAKRTFAQFMDIFAWMLPWIPDADKWPADWQNPKYRIDFLNRPPEAIPAHI